MRKKPFLIALLGTISLLSSCANDDPFSDSSYVVSSSASSSGSDSSSSESTTSHVTITKTGIINFGNELNNNGSTLLSSSNFAKYASINGDIFITGVSNISKIYANEGAALRFGSSSAVGSLTIDFGSTYALRKVICTISPYVNDVSSFYISAGTSFVSNDISIEDENNSYEIPLSIDSNYLTIKGVSERFYLHSISIEYVIDGGSGDGDDVPSSSASNSSGNIDTGAGTYYASIDWSKRGASLKSALWELTGKNYKDLGYSGVLEAYKTTDTDENGKIIDIYSSYRFSLSQTGNYKKEGDTYNREHTIPQSVFGKKTPMKSDVHHLFPTDGYVNNKRGTYPHGYVASATYTSTNNTRIGSGDSSKNYTYSGTCCEVPDEYKGDVARAYFYMVTRYEDKLPSWGSYPSFDGNSYPALKKWAINTYLEWNDLDPVSEKEIKRNNAIAALQCNRNPFVDHPEAAHYIWDSAR